MNPLKYIIDKLTSLGFNRRAPVDHTTVRQVLSKITNNLFILDSTYRQYTMGEILSYSRKALAKYDTYLKNLHDCDDYAIKFMIAARDFMPYIPLGLALIEYHNGSRHAVNIFLDEFNKPYYIEPQTGKRIQRLNFKTYLILI